MISFRLSGQEYEILKALHPHHGARNLSDFARTAMLRHLNSEPPAAIQQQATSVQSKVEELNERVLRMQEDLQRLTSLLSHHLTAPPREPKALQATNVW